ncbi:MAG: hypothetical protein IKT01_04845 [Eubacteriaceae bacterium]|nr:hypothetical protein [Eubacteriaceae bacterium]
MEHNELFEKTPVRKLFFKLAIPSMLSHIAGGITEIFEGVFVGSNLGATALAAVNLVIPIIIISGAVADMIASGSSVHISIELGKKNDEKARGIFTSACIMIFAVSLLVAGLFLFFIDEIISMMGATGELARQTKEYALLFAAMAPLSMSYFAFDDYLRICGKVKYSMVVNIATSLLTAFLLWLLLGKLHLGLWASGLVYNGCSVIGAIASAIPLLSKKLKLYFVKPETDLKLSARIIVSGIPAFTGNVTVSLIILMTNTLLLKISGELAVAALSVYGYIESVLRCAVYGMINGVRPAIGYNYGAHDEKRLERLVRTLFAGTFITSLICYISARLALRPIVGIFCPQNDTALMDMTFHASMICIVSITISWFSASCGMLFTSLNKPVYATVMSFMRTLVFPAATMYIQAAFWGVDGVWYSFITCEVLSAVLSGIFLFPAVSSVRKEIAS